ncbi:DUF1396 domain-containing protein [Streptomyces sp. NPDC087420]|uniref:DUF1396 domain-containing protein n=1 Tax=Streptomyces sp. NPDC087420 TaxID=3365785 RepID=UPI0038357228
MKMTYRKAAGMALAGALLCGSAACTADGGEPAGRAGSKPLKVTPVAAIERAVTNSEKVTSLGYVMDGEIPGQGALRVVAALTVEPPALETKMTIDIDGKPSEFDMRILPDGMYMKGGGKAAADLDGRSWVKFPLGAAAKGEDNPLGALSGQADRNPAEESASLTAAKDLKEVGPETVDGAATKHYTGTVTLDAMRASLTGRDAAAKARQGKSLDEYEDMGIERMTMDLWIDPKADRTKQFRMRGAGKQGPLDLTVTFTHYNKPLTITAPPAARTMDFADVLAGKAGASG